MLNIQRSAEPQELTDFARRHPANDWAELHRDDHALYEALLKRLCEEQHGVSGYSEERLDCERSNYVHIDHFHRKGIPQYKTLTYQWDNMVAAVHEHQYSADSKDSRAKSPADYLLIINPVQENPADYFDYNSFGAIIPRNDLKEEAHKKADYTIETFQLNHPRLVKKREQMMRMVQDYLQGGVEKKDIAALFEGEPFPTFVKWILDNI